MAQQSGDESAKNTSADRKRIRDEKQKLKNEQKQLKKEVKERARQLAKEESELEDESEGSPISVALVTIIIVVIWLGIIVLIIKTNLGGFGENILAPILKDVPVINMILPNSAITETADEEGYMGYSSLKEAVEQIQALELEVEKVRSNTGEEQDVVASLRAEIERLKTFENNQVEFQRIKTEFYEEVVYSEKGPGAEEYRKYFEEMDPTTAEFLYKQVVKEEEVSKEIKDYALAYSEMKPKEAAAIFEKMTNNLELAAKILGVMDATDRGKILGVMDADIAARLTKIMDPEG